MKTILITGGTGKIGGQLVAHFVKTGWEVITTSRSRENLSKLMERGLLNAQQLEHIQLVEVDFTDPSFLQAFQHFFDQHPQCLPEVLVNNARDLSMLKVSPDGTSAREHLLGEYLVDVVVPYELSMWLGNKAAAPLETIINVSSIYGMVPFNPNLYETFEASAPIQYSLAKAASIQLTKELAVRLAPREVRVNAVSYGGVQGRVDTEFQQRYARLCPMKRMLTEEEVVGPVAFLASSEARGITGHNLVQDGGWTIW